MGSYVNETDIEAITAFAINDTTTPTTAQVAIWITQIEADVDARALYSYTLTDQYIDVPRQVGYPPKQTVGWLRAIANEQFDSIITKNILVPPFVPIVSISSLSRRTSSLGETEAWEGLTEGRGSGASYVQLKKRTKTNQFLGFALYFFDNVPYDGPQRVKMTYNYGWNLSSTIIGEWCSLKVALKVLDAVMHDSTPIGAGQYGTLDISVSINPEVRRKDVLARIKEIEDDYFPPKKKLGIALI